VPLAGIVPSALLAPAIVASPGVADGDGATFLPVGPVTEMQDAPVDESGTVTDTDPVDAVVAPPEPYYLDLHTVRNPAGEIRGGIRETGTR